MTQWLSITRIQKIILFLGKRVFRYLCIGVLIGTSIFAAEIAFAYGIQTFLVELGVMHGATIELPRWVPQGSLVAVLVFIFGAGTLRALLQWAQIHLQVSAYEYLREHHRVRVLKWAFNSESASSSEVTELFNEKINIAALAISSIQSLTVLTTTACLLGLTLLAISPVLTGISAIGLLLIAIPLKKSDARIKAAGQGLANEWSRTNRRMLMNIKNLLLMQIYGTQAQEEKLATESMASYRKHAVTLGWLGGLKFAIPQIFGILLICFMTLGANSRDTLSSSALISYFYLFIRLLQTISPMNLNFASLLNYWPQLKAVAKWWAEHSSQERSHEGTDIQAAPLPLSHPVGWKLTDVGFRYPISSWDVLDNISLTIPPSTTLVLTGPSGAGKSTLLHLILGGAVPTRGKIEIVGSDGKYQPLENEKKRLRRSLGFVGPESLLIEESILRNITYGLQHEPTKADIDLALEQAECQFIWDMSGGLEYRLTEQGQGLSAGQKQRLSLARALLRKPKVLILDEPTANLDAEMESRLVDTLSKLKSEMTIIAVSHRPALLRIADQHFTL